MTTRTPKWPTSRCSVSEAASRACLVAQYMPASGAATFPSTDVTLTTTPRPRSRMAGTRAVMRRSGPKKLVSNIRRATSSG